MHDLMMLIMGCAGGFFLMSDFPKISDWGVRS